MNLFHKRSRRSWADDIRDLHDKMGHTPAFAQLDRETAYNFLKFRLDFLQEELDEMKSTMTAEDIVDACIDLCVVAIGTLDAFEVDVQKAWEAVHEANMAKEGGSNPTRPNPWGLPDMIKPEGWVAPTHEGNHGRLSHILEIIEREPEPPTPPRREDFKACNTGRILCECGHVFNSAALWNSFKEDRHIRCPESDCRKKYKVHINDNKKVSVTRWEEV